MSSRGTKIRIDEKTLSAEEAQFLQLLMNSLDDPHVPQALRSATLMQVVAPLMARGEKRTTTNPIFVKSEFEAISHLFRSAQSLSTIPRLVAVRQWGDEELRFFCSLPQTGSALTRTATRRHGSSVRTLQEWFVPLWTMISPCLRHTSPSSRIAQISPLRTIR